ncbi:ArnT family glycosyltransferase [Paludisphaera mucosa]|uniref:Glycosyltransferase family 39 protein n=1 Tax=Paludisphaera mucosa TaxID=3030827 RepID=A0ABT6FFF0_9BACT|nr:glycosyltransferase family 39 protein [Paludisphaera mucosa]MDG3006229.1 glycosyltransferase family 39 protein [Paludisphaera mucosa]
MTRDNPWSPPLAAWLVVLAAVAARLAVVIAAGGRFEDPDNYLPLARSVAAGEGLTLRGRPTAYRPPLYPLILAPLTAVAGDRPTFGLAILHIALGAVAAGCTILAARRMGTSARRSLVAGLIVALDPVLVWQSRSVMTETPTAFLIAAALALAAHECRWAAPGAGVALGLAALCRPSILPGAGLAALAAALAAPGTHRERLQRGIGLGVAVAAVLTPWAVRNKIALGEAVWTTTHGGYTLALANNEVYYRQVLDGPAGGVWTGREQWLWWDSVNRRTAGMSEPAADRLMRDEAIELARREPAKFAHACAARLATFWSPTPAAGVYGGRARALTLAWTLPLWAALLLGLASPTFRRWPGIVAPSLILGLTVVHSFYWTDLRMRAPITPAIALIASSATWPRRMGS